MRYVRTTCTRDFSREMKFLAGRPIIMQAMKTHYLEGSGDTAPALTDRDQWHQFSGLGLTTIGFARCEGENVYQKLRRNAIKETMPIEEPADQSSRCLE